MCDTDKFDLFFRHSTPKFFRPKRKKAPSHFDYSEDHLVVTTGFYGPKVTLKEFTVLEVSLFTGQRKYCINAIEVKLRHFCKEDYHAILMNGVTPQLLRYK